MKQLLVVMVLLLGCSNDTREAESPKTSQAIEAGASPTPAPVPSADEKLIADPIVEKGIWERLNRPEGDLTEADLAEVKFLYLSNTQITDAGLKEVAQLQQLAGLYLRNTQITDAGLKEVAKLQKLDFIDLSETQITDEGLTELAKLQQLEKLGLEGTQVTDTGVTELKKALPNCTIVGP